MLTLLLALASLGDFQVSPGFTVTPASLAAAEPSWKDALKGAKPYTSTAYSQRVAVTNGVETIQLYHRSTDDVWTNAPTSFNPNRSAPWSSPGGLDGVKGWKSELSVVIPEGAKIRVWRERVAIKDGGLLPKWRWSYPDGAKFADVLSAGGEVFEVRVREKVKGKWSANVLFKDAAKAPAGYKTAGVCADCHKSAGASLQYGIGLRGDDSIFSFSPFIEGKWEFDGTWPLDVDAKVDAAPTSPVQSVATVYAQPAMVTRRSAVCST